MRARSLWMVVAVVVMASSMAACGGSSSDGGREAAPTDVTEAPAPVPGGKVVYGLIAETNGWDPTASNWGPWSLIIANAMFDTLARFDHQGGIQPYLAEDFRPNENYSQWTIKLRDGIQFHNGEVLDAAAVAKNIQFHRESPLTGQVFAHVTDVQVVDDRSVLVSFDEPVAQFPIIVSTQVGVMMAPAMIDNPNRGREPIGTGPFEVDEWVPDAQMTLVRNENYWQKDAAGNQLPYLDEVEFRPIPDDEARASSLLAGDIDMAQVSDPIDLESFRQDESFTVVDDLRSEEDETFVMLNTTAAPFDQEIARQALAYGTDREAFNDVQYDGLAQIAESAYRPESVWYHDVDYPEYDPDRARELVAQYEEQFGPFQFKLKSNPAVRTLAAAQWLQASWEELGMEVEIDSTEIASQIAQIVVGDYQATMWAQFGSAHPLLETAWWSCEYVTPPPEIALNFARNCNAEASQVMTASRYDPDLEAQKPYWDNVQEMLNEDLPYIWLTHQQLGVVTRPEVKNLVDFKLPNDTPGLAFNNGAHPLHQVWIAD